MRLVRVHFSHVIAKWSRAYSDFTWLRGCSVQRRENGASAIPRKPRIYIFRSSAQNTADGQGGKGESEVGVHLEICFELGAKLYKSTPIGTAAPPKHSTESG
jgi:hypothetical protein